MINIINYELRKIFKWKGLYIAFCISLVLYGLYIYSIAPSSLASYRAAYEYYRPGEGYVTEEKIALAEEGIKDINKLHDEGIKFDEKSLGKSIFYRDILEVVKQRDIYKDKINYYEKEDTRNRNENLSYELLKRGGSIEAAYYTEGWQRIIEFSWKMGHYFILALVILGVSIIIPQEYWEGMDSLIGSTRESKHKVIYAKIGAAFAYTALVVGVFAVINVITNWYFYGLKGWGAPLKNIYFSTPYRIKIWQFFILQQLLYTMNISIFAMITLLISVLTRNSTISLTTGGLIYTILELISKYAVGKPAPGSTDFIIKGFTNLKDICTSYLNIFNIFGRPVLYERVLTVLILIIIVLMAVSVVFSYRKYNYTRK